MASPLLLLFSLFCITYAKYLAIPMLAPEPRIGNQLPPLWKDHIAFSIDAGKEQDVLRGIVVSEIDSKYGSVVIELHHIENCTVSVCAIETKGVFDETVRCNNNVLNTCNSTQEHCIAKIQQSSPEQKIYAIYFLVSLTDESASYDICISLQKDNEEREWRNHHKHRHGHHKHQHKGSEGDDDDDDGGHWHKFHKGSEGDDDDDGEREHKEDNNEKNKEHGKANHEQGKHKGKGKGHRSWVGKVVVLTAGLCLIGCVITCCIKRRCKNKSPCKWASFFRRNCKKSSEETPANVAPTGYVPMEMVTPNGFPSLEMGDMINHPGGPQQMFVYVQPVAPPAPN